MSDIRPVTPLFAVSPQIRLEDLPEIAQQGFKVLICNRPDGESPDQPTTAQVQAAAGSAGLEFHAIPIRGVASLEQVSEMQSVIANAKGPVLAYCRSGTRSITAWALGVAPTMGGEAVVEAAAAAGYDLSPLFA